MVGGTDYVRSSYNRATTALRQPGSAWKLFVYLAALEAGYNPESTVTDEPVTIDGWSPRNSNGRFTGKINVRTAFAYSVNSVAAQLGNEVGFLQRGRHGPPLWDQHRDQHPAGDGAGQFGGPPDRHDPRLCRRFGARAFGGTLRHRARHHHRRARDLSPCEPRSYILVPDYVAAGITDLLQTAVNTGTGRAAQIGRPVAGKTGTTTSNKDGWFIGFSSGITTGVWMGRG